MKKFLILLGLLALALPASRAGAKDTFGVAWNVAIPTADTADFTSGLQFRGISLEWRTFTTRTTAFGINASWEVFTDQFEGTTDDGVLAVTGKSWRYVNAVPLYVSWHHYTAGDRRGKRMFFGLNGGLAHIERRAEYGLFVDETKEWQWALAPEIGMNLPWDSFLGWLAVRYNIAFAQGDHDAQQWLELRFGFGMD